MRANLGIVTIGLAVVVLAAAGCASPGEVPAPTATTPSVAPPVAEPSAEPSPTETAVADAVLAFDGDCGNVLADPSAYVGELMDYPAQTWPSAVSTLGGLICSWYGAGGEMVTVVALPTSEVPDDLRAAYGSITCESAYDGEECRVAGESGSTWIFASAPRYGEEPELAPVLAEALAAAAQYDEPVAPTSDDSWWSGVDCEALGERIDLAEVFEGADFEAGYPTGFAASPVSDLIDDAGVNFWCPWYSYESSAGIWMNVLPGAGFQWDRLAGEPAEVEGAEAAVTVSQFDEEVLVATDGTNIVTVREAPGRPEDLAARVLAALG